MRFDVIVEKRKFEICVSMETMGKRKDVIILTTTDNFPVDEIAYHVGRHIKDCMVMDNMKKKPKKPRC